MDATGNAYVTGFNSDNAFKITPAGAITRIIDATGDAQGISLPILVARRGRRRQHIRGGY